MSEVGAASVRPRLAKLLIEAAAKHLPPSASQLRLLDVNGETGAILTTLRGDLDVAAVMGNVAAWSDTMVPENSADAIVAFDYVLNETFLLKALAALRPGGRLIVVNSRGEVSELPGHILEEAGYTRILVETAVECPLPTGVLVRGEKPHITDNTHDRVQQVAARDNDTLDLTDFKGRYVHLLIVQTPNTPVWKMNDGESVAWQAVAIQGNHGPTLLAFSSLPKTVSFMQPAVINGQINGINKVGKFSRDTAARWSLPVLVNPASDILASHALMLIPVDASTAESSDE